MTRKQKWKGMLFKHTIYIIYVLTVGMVRNKDWYRVLKKS